MQIIASEGVMLNIGATMGNTLTGIWLEVAVGLVLQSKLLAMVHQTVSLSLRLLLEKVLAFAPTLFLLMYH